MAALHTAIYSAASPECLNNDQTPPLTSIAALHTALYSAASPECLNNDQTPPLTATAVLITTLLTYPATYQRAFYAKTWLDGPLAHLVRRLAHPPAKMYI